MKIEKIILKNIPKEVKGHILPIKDKIEISQGYDEPYSHFAFQREQKNIIYDHRFALDFKTPIKTKVYASKNGIVEYIEDSFEKYYLGNKAEKGLKILTNKILINHKDGTYSLYSHLQKNSAKVYFEDEVNQG